MLRIPPYLHTHSEIVVLLNMKKCDTLEILIIETVHSVAISDVNKDSTIKVKVKDSTFKAKDTFFP